ncbi:MAG TPA: SpoIIE family protein phosphatase, partial [Ktedonobacterales bacterium]
YEGTAYVANAGDSRAYVLEGETLRRITSDHSLVEQLVAGGIIADADRYTHPERNQIFRSLGLNREMEVDFFTQWLRPDMRLLLCSDGLWEMVRDNEITRIMRANADPQAACDALIQAANKAGGEDNISAVVVQIGA